MPQPCKNDPLTKYKGTEPSPKGLGYCAHAQALGSKKTGLDGKQYQVRADKNGKKSWKLASTVPGGAKKKSSKAKKVTFADTAVTDAAVAGTAASVATDIAVAAVSDAAKAKDKADKKIANVVAGAVAVGGPAAGVAILDKIAEIQARLQTAKRYQIDQYLKAKKKQGLFKKPLKAKGYLMQDARADALAIRGAKGVALSPLALKQPSKYHQIDYFALTGHHVDPEDQHVEIVFNYPKEVMDLVEYFSDYNRPKPITEQQEQQQQRKFEQGIKDVERALWAKVEPVLKGMGIHDFAYNEVSYAGELTFDRIWIYPSDFTTELVENLKKALPAGYTMSLQVIPSTYNGPEELLMPL
jgi:hypothetical protein